MFKVCLLLQLVNFLFVQGLFTLTAGSLCVCSWFVYSYSWFNFCMFMVCLLLQLVHFLYVHDFFTLTTGSFFVCSCLFTLTDGSFFVCS